MIIMFIFLGLTIVFIIGTAIYLNKSKTDLHKILIKKKIKAKK